MLRLNGSNRHKVVILETTTPQHLFDGYENFSANGWGMDRHNEALDALKKGWSLFEICETANGQHFYITSSSVVEFTEKGGIKVHPSTTAPFWAKQTERVHTVACRGFDMLYLIDSTAW